MLKNFDTIAPRPRPTSVAPVVEPAEVAETIEAPAGTIMAWLASRTADYGQSTPTPTPVAEEQPKAAPPKKVYTPWPGPGLAPSGYEWYQVPDDEKVNA
jgi:cytoskeletal protein RodZ